MTSIMIQTLSLSSSYVANQIFEVMATEMAQIRSPSLARLFAASHTRRHVQKLPGALMSGDLAS